MPSDISSKKIYFFLVAFFIISNMQTTSAISLYGLCIVGFGIISFLLFIHYPKVNIESFLLFLSVAFLLLLVTFIQLPDYIQYKGLPTIIMSKALLVVYWGICTILVSGTLSRIEDSLMLRVLGTTIMIMSVFLFVQIISFYIFDERLDFSFITGGEYSRSYYGELYRPSGFLPEPAVYSGHLCALLALYLYYKKKIDVVFYVGVASVFLSFSTMGALLSIMIYLCYTFSHRKNISFYILCFVFISAFSFYILPLLYERFELFLSGNDASNNIKIQAITNFFANDKILLFGYGLVGRDNELLPSYYEALKDVTIFGEFYSIFGVVFGTFLLALYALIWFSSKLELRYKLILIIPLFKLCNPSYVFFSIYIVMFFLILRKGKRDNFY